MKAVLYNYDIYPKVVLADTEVNITIRPLGWHAAFEKEKAYTFRIFKVSESNPRVYPERNNSPAFELVADSDGCMRFATSFSGEGEYYINIYEDPAEKPKIVLSVYSLSHDMKGRIPLRGDLHVHTRRSDGKEAPENVVANYRGHGYDFLTISDHKRYYPSLEAMEAFKDVSDINVVPGEEIHLPLNDVHYVNFGGTYSINALVLPSFNEEKCGSDLKYRSLNGKAPDPMTKDEFLDMIRKKAENIQLPNESERLSFAVMEWIYEHVKAADGLGIFPHPYWLCQMMHLPEEYTEYIYEKAPFDAFEVLGGGSYYQHNGFQTALYYEMKAKGIDHPVVGSTDSHGSTEHNRNSLICSTIVFAYENTREALISAIKSKYSVAVDTISAEYRLVGDFRLVKYGSFLMENYFPLHDMACNAEGYYLNRYLAGDERACEVLKAMKGQIAEMQKKYFAL